MSDFRCEKCHNLFFKYKFIGKICEIEVKCFKCNNFNKFIINLPVEGIKNYEKNNKYKRK
jgi:phage FluMu protein Com